MGTDIMLNPENKYKQKLDTRSGGKLWQSMSMRNIIGGLKPEF